MQSYMHMRCQAQQLDSYSSARHCSTPARQLVQLDRPRQTSTDLDRPRQTSTPRHMESGSTGSTVTRQARQARPRQHLDSASTEPRQLDSSTARAQCTVVRSIRAGRGDTPQRQRTRSNTRHNAQPRPPVSGPAGARPRRGELGCVVRDVAVRVRRPPAAVSSVLRRELSMTRLCKPTRRHDSVSYYSSDRTPSRPFGTRARVELVYCCTQYWRPPPQL